MSLSADRNARQALLLVVPQDVGPRERDDRQPDGRRGRAATCRLAPDIQSMPARIAANTSEVPRSGWSMIRASGGADEQARAEDRRQPVELVLVGRQVAGQHDDHEDLGQLAELERERPDRDPARGPADAVADRQGQHEQPELEAVDRPGQGLEPAVVERRRDDEQRRARSPAHIRPAGERRAGLERRAAGLDAVRVGHDQAGRASSPAYVASCRSKARQTAPTDLAAQSVTRDGFGSDDAHQSCLV